MVRFPPPNRRLGSGLAARSASALAACAAVCTLGLASAAAAATPTELLAAYSALAGAPAQAARGQRFFLASHAQANSCASCHGKTPSSDGQHASTGKRIGPLAPAFNPARFTDAAKADKWFRRNCNDVVGRECSPAEKADVLAWLISIK